jgi:hypothetical protein
LSGSGPTELGSLSSLGNFMMRNSAASELHSRPPAHEIDSEVSASELASPLETPPKTDAGE